MLSSLRFALVVFALVACQKEEEPAPAESPPETPAAETPEPTPPPAEPAPAEPAPSAPTAAGDSPCRAATEPLEVGETNVAVETLTDDPGIRISARVGDELEHLECTREGWGGERFSSAQVEEARIGDQDVWLVKEIATAIVVAEATEDGEQNESAIPIAWVFTKDLTYVGQLGDDTADAISVADGVLTIGTHRLTITNGALAPAP